MIVYRQHHTICASPPGSCTCVSLSVNAVQVLDPLLYSKQPPPTPVSSFLMTAAIEAEQQLSVLQHQQQLAVSTLQSEPSDAGQLRRSIQRMQQQIQQRFLEPAVSKFKAMKAELEGLIATLNPQVKFASFVVQHQ